MAKLVSSWPPGRPVELTDPTPVRARHVVYVPGYDPDATKRTRMLFVREFLRYARRFGLVRHEVSRAARLPEELGLSWTVRAAAGAWSTETTFEVLGWDDIVQADFARPVPRRIALLLVGMADSLLKGVMTRFFRLNWKFASVVVYPFAMLCLLGACAGLAAFAGVALAAWPLRSLGDGGRWAAEAAVGAAMVVAVVRLATPLFDRWFVWHLLHDWVFNWQHGNGRRPDYEARVDRFADHLVEVARTTSSDELLVVGHSSGCVMATEIVARALSRSLELGRGHARVVLMTVGSCIPLVALNPRATRAREAIGAIAATDRVLWVEYQAPQDWMNFPGFNPGHDLGHPAVGYVNPVIRSARFAEIVSPATYRAILYRPFRMHFQFLMANDNPGEYDFFGIVVGPLSMAQRCRGSDDEPDRNVLVKEDTAGDELDEVMKRRIRVDVE